MANAKIQKCCIKLCVRKSASFKHQLCKAHLNRYYRHGYPGSTAIVERKKHIPFGEQ